MIDEAFLLLAEPADDLLETAAARNVFHVCRYRLRGEADKEGKHEKKNVELNERAHTLLEAFSDYDQSWTD